MYALVHQIIQGRIHHTMPLQRRHPHEGGTHHTHVEMSLACVGMPHVPVTLIQHLELERLQRRFAEPGLAPG